MRPFPMDAFKFFCLLLSLSNLMMLCLVRFSLCLLCLAFTELLGYVGLYFPSTLNFFCHSSYIFSVTAPYRLDIY